MKAQVQTALVVLIGVCVFGVMPAHAWLGIFGGGDQESATAVEEAPAKLPDPGKAGSVEEELEQLREAFKFFKADRERIREMLDQEKEEKEALLNEIEELKQALEKSRANVSKMTIVLRQQLAAAVRDGRDVADLRRELKAWEKEADGYLSGDVEKEMDKLQEANERQQSQITLLKEQLREVRDELRTAKRMRASGNEEPPPMVAQQDEQADVLAMAQEAMDAQQLDRAFELFERALDEGSDEITARMGMAASLYAMDRLEDALEQVDMLLNMDPDNPGALGLKGIISWRTGNAEDAVAMLDEAIAKEDESAQLYNYRGIIAHAQEDYVVAEQSFRKAIELQPEHSEALFNLAVVLATKTEPDLGEARNVYETALRQGSERHAGLEDFLYPAE